MEVKEVNRAYEILSSYKGKNDRIAYLSRKYAVGKVVLNDFDTNYINENFDYEPIEVNRTFDIASDFGNRLQEKYELEFIPKKLWIGRIIGEMGESYHCYGQFRLSVLPQLMYVPKKAILTPIEVVDHTKVEVDFDKLDAMSKNPKIRIKEHQKTGIKFMVANKKCINADSMGLGKTLTCLLSAICTDRKRTLIITTASLKTNWLREISNYVDESEISIISGSEWKDVKRFNIINYDIIDNFYNVPEEQVYEDHNIYDKDGNIVETLKVPVMVKSKTTGKMIPKMQKSRKKDLIKKCMDESPLFNAGFDCVIIDEVHKLSNNKSIRYKTISDFLKRAKPEYVFLATGTPLTNRPINLYWILKLIDADITKDYFYYVKRYCGGREMKLRDGRKIMTMKDATNLEELREKIKHIYIRRLPSEIGDMVEKNVTTRYYDLNEEQITEYKRLWNEYLEAQENIGRYDSEKYKQLVEGTLVRQFLAKEMVKNTIELAEDFIEQGEKVVIACNFQNEIDAFYKHFGKKSVVYNGTMTPKQKDAAQDKFMNDDKVMVFIGNEVASGVGINLTVSSVMIFNSISWSMTDNRQMEDRIYRLTQTRDVECIYQLFNETVNKDMFEKVLYKGVIMDATIKSEEQKKEKI